MLLEFSKISKLSTNPSGHVAAAHGDEMGDVGLLEKSPVVENVPQFRHGKPHLPPSLLNNLRLHLLLTFQEEYHEIQEPRGESSHSWGFQAPFDWKHISFNERVEVSMKWLNGNKTCLK